MALQIRSNSNKQCKHNEAFYAAAMYSNKQCTPNEAFYAAAMYCKTCDQQHRCTPNEAFYAAAMYSKTCDQQHRCMPSEALDTAGAILYSETLYQQPLMMQRTKFLSRKVVK